MVAASTSPSRDGPTSTDTPAATDVSLWHSHFDALARYHRWATVRLFEHVDRLSEDDYRRDVGLFFHSVHGTLNQLLVAEHRVCFRVLPTAHRTTSRSMPSSRPTAQRFAMACSPP